MALTKQCLRLFLLLVLFGGNRSAATTTQVQTTPYTNSTITVGTTTAETTTASAGTTVTATTPKPVETTTTGSTPASVTTSTTNTPATGGTTAVANTSTPVATTATTKAITTADPGPCASRPCPSHSICQELLDRYTCLCGPGLSYNTVQKSCTLAKTFSGDLTLTQTFVDEMSNSNSDIFKETATNILEKLRKIFETDASYLESTVLNLKKGSVIADVDIFFTPSSNITETEVQKTLQTAISNSDGSLSGFNARNICIRGFCDVSTALCEGNNGLATCSCKEGYIRITATPQACTSCPSGKKAVNFEQCAECSFGYSGFNCGESYLLILVVVGCVLGTLLLGTFIGAMVLLSRSKKMTKTPTNGSVEFTKPEGIPRIPRANANSGWQPSNLEMADSGSRSALVMRNRPETTDMWDYDYSNDARGYKNQTPSRPGYGASAANNGPRATRNPYYDEFDDKTRRY